MSPPTTLLDLVQLWIEPAVIPRRPPTISSMAFTGIPAEAFDFYDALGADKSRTFWAEHKDEYLQYVRGPLAALGEELGPEFGEPHLYRPYRDIRFSKDGTHTSRQFQPASWMGTRQAVSRVRENWQQVATLMHWLTDKVGPGQGPVGRG